MVVDLGAEEDDPLAQQPRVDVEGALVAAVGLDDHRNQRAHRVPPARVMQPWSCRSYMQPGGCQMEVEREVVLDAPPEEVWEALTEPERLEEWFANDVEFDLERGGDFRWDDGEVAPRGGRGGRRPSGGSRSAGGIPAARRRARSLSPSSRSRPGRGSSSPRRPPATGRGGSARRMPEDGVFSALSDPSRRHLLESLAEPRVGLADRARRAAPGHTPGGVEASRRARRCRSRRGEPRRPRDPLSPDAGAAGRGARLDGADRRPVGRAARQAARSLAGTKE